MDTPKSSYQGIAIDPRSALEKSFDFTYEELGMGAEPVVWKEKTKEEWKTYKIRNQDGSLSCVGQATAKILGIHEVKEGREFKDLSPKFIYTRRDNYPDGGMWLPNALSIACQYGSCEEYLLPCENQGETWLNDKSQETIACVDNAKLYKGKNYIFISSLDIDAIASVIQSGYAVLLGFRFDNDEWTDVPFLKENSSKSAGHGVAGIDFTLHKGEKSIIIEDSWGPEYGMGGHRIITETFLKARCFYAGYVTSLVTENQEVKKPSHTFNKYLKFQQKDKEVIWLQKCLQYLGLFPKNVPFSETYGPITRKAVSDFQKKYLSTNNQGLQVGPATLRALNTLFSI